MFVEKSTSYLIKAPLGATCRPSGAWERGTRAFLYKHDAPMELRN